MHGPWVVGIIGFINATYPFDAKTKMASFFVALLMIPNLCFNCKMLWSKSIIPCPLAF
jgi:hypothetical protein